MRKSLVLGLAVLSLLAPALPFNPHKPLPAKPMAFAEEVEEVVQTSDEQNESQGIEYYSQQIKISVIGEAEKMLAPDRGVVYACVSGFGKDCTQAKDEAMDLFDKSVEMLAEKGVKRENIIIDNFYSRPCKDCHNNGCHGNLSFSFVIEELANADDILSALLDNGVEEISAICYEVSNIEEEYNNLLTLALESAREKAKILLGDNLQLVDIREESVYYSNCLYKDYVENAGGYVGGINVRARVEATFI